MCTVSKENLYLKKTCEQGFNKHKILWKERGGFGEGRENVGGFPLLQKNFPSPMVLLVFQFGNAELDILPALESGGLFVVKLGDALGGSVESVGIACEEAGIVEPVFQRMLFVFQCRHLAGQGFQFVLEHLKLALFLEGQLARADLGRRGQRLGFRLVGVGSHGLGRWRSQSVYPPTYSRTCPSPSSASVVVTRLSRNSRSWLTMSTGP